MKNTTKVQVRSNSKIDVILLSLPRLKKNVFKEPLKNEMFWIYQEKKKGCLQTWCGYISQIPTLWETVVSHGAEYCEK